MSKAIRITIILLLLCVTNARLMYVWDKEFERSEDCGIEDTQKTSCFHRVHVQRLKKSIHRAEVDTVLFSFPQNELKRCSERVVSTLRELREEKVKVYQLYAASDAAFSEQHMVQEVNRFNEHCGETFDGVAVNNEAFVKCCDDTCDQSQALTFLENMKRTKDNASPLPFHFSIAWHWGDCSKKPFDITLDGITKSATQHMIDIADSVDVQVAWSEAPEMIRRARVAGYSDSEKPFFVLAYTNKVEDCRLTFFPGECVVGDSTEKGLFDAFEAVESELTSAKGGIHYYSDAFFSDLPGWPSCNSLRRGKTSTDALVPM